MQKDLLQQKLRPHREIIIVLAFYFAALIATTRLETLIFKAPAKWESWFDQSQYIHSAQSFLHGVLTPADHWYPLLYPLLISPFLSLPPFLGVLIPDAICFVLAFVGFRLVAQRFGFSPLETLIIFLLTTVAYPFPWAVQTWLVPTTTTLSAALIWLSLGIACRFFHDQEQQPPSGKLAFLQGVLLGLIPLCRPADAVVSAAIGLCLLKPLLFDRQDWRSLASISGAAIMTILAYILLHLRIYGWQVTPYMQLSAAIGMNFSWLGWKSYLIIVEPRPWYPYGSGMLKVFPWIPLGVAGMLLSAKQPNRRMLTALVTLPALVYAAVMLAYLDLLPSGLWRFRNFGYFKWMMPLLGLFAWKFLREFKLRRTESIAVLGLMLLIASIRLNPVLATPDETARMVTFAAPTEDFSLIYFAHSTITDRAGVMRNGYEYHQVPDDKGLVMSEALSRDFTGDERWNGPGVGVEWSGTPWGTQYERSLPGQFPRVPLARYRPEISLGWPCWLPPYVCSTDLPASGLK
jgi:hypothetical protein